jgi:hypothetical protein
MADLALFVIAVVVVLGVGLTVGMLVAPILLRWVERDDADPADEEPGAGQP